MAQQEIRKVYLYREGDRFFFSPTRNCTSVGYFEYGNYDGIPRVYWCWSRSAQQDTKAQNWVAQELLMREEQLWEVA
jgi:hypothetical protein